MKFNSDFNNLVYTLGLSISLRILNNYSKGFNFYFNKNGFLKGKYKIYIFIYNKYFKNTLIRPIYLYLV